MLKTRLILLTVIVILVVAMYQLPKVVVDSSEEAISAQESGESPLQMDEIHSLALTPEIEERIDRLTEETISNELPEKRAIFADSLAEAYFSIQKYDSAAKYFDILVSIDSTYTNVERSGNAYYEAFTYAFDQESAGIYGQKAKERYDALLAVDESRLDLMNKVAMTLVSTQNPMAGIQMLNQILDDDENNAEALFNLGILAVQTGQFERAIERFTKLKEVDSSNIQGRFYLGLSYKETGRKEEAIAELKQVKANSSDEELNAIVDSLLEELN